MKPSLTELRAFNALFQDFPSGIDRAAIEHAWRILPERYNLADRELPYPVWARRPLSDSGSKAWETLRSDVCHIPTTKPLSMYIHIPFCVEKCSFCDCYSFKLGRYETRHTQTYANLLIQELDLWSQLGSMAHRPVTTLHLGGGTPTILDVKTFSRIVEHCRQQFAITADTELALESTSSELTPEVMDMLASQHFTRLHIGVQTLDDAIRSTLKRRELSSQLLEKLDWAVNRGWVVSVDLIYGLPGQTLKSLYRTIQALVDAGVDGFSLYELQISSRNRKFAEMHQLIPRDRLSAYVQLQSASQILTKLGYEKRLFNHFARERDKNLYFTFPERGEDLVAIGTIADGVFNDYHYRHSTYPHYNHHVSDTSPGLIGGLRRNARENQLFPLETALLSARLDPTVFEQKLGMSKAHTLLSEWRSAGLLTDNQNTGLCLTDNGSWFVSAMIADIHHLADREI